ncbi:MAG TPA: YtxH domain-containing protein [Terriglobales bacterium]|nr:YtxH domain-containing protein [Terriglobales bacterium]
MKTAFLAGLGLGAAVGMLIAPKSGAETRDELEDFARNSLNREKLNEVLDEGRERLQNVVDQGREQINSVRERVQPVVDSAREGVSSAMGRAGELKDSIANRGLLAILNEWSHERLIEIDGIGPVLATKIIQNRPYESLDALENSKLPPSAIESLKKAA